MLYQRRTKRYLVYTSGLISLVLLPVLFLNHIDLVKQYHRYTTMEILLPEKIGLADQHIFDEVDFSNRNYHTITLTGNQSEDLVKLAYAQLELKRIVSDGDTVNGLHVILGYNAKYWAMVELFDISNITGINHYVLYEINYWGFHKPVSAHTNYYDNLPTMCCCTQPYEPTLTENFLSTIKQHGNSISFFVENIKFIWPSAILFLLMLILTLQKFLKQ